MYSGRISKFSSLMLMLVLVLSVGCTSKKETLTHDADKAKIEQEKNSKKRAKPEKERSEETKKRSKKQAEDPKSFSDLPEGQIELNRRGKVTVDGRRTIPQGRGRVFEKGRRVRKAPVVKAPNKIIENKKGGVVLEYTSPDGESLPGRHPRMDREDIAGIEIETLHSALANPLDVVYLPNEQELENCNARLKKEVHDVSTGGAELDGRYFTSGRKDGYLAFIKSLVRCQEAKMRAGSLGLAANIDKPVIRIDKMMGAEKGRVIVEFDVVNGAATVQFKLSGDLIRQGRNIKNYSELVQTFSSDSRYAFQGKLLCVDQNGSCENAMVMIEQIVNGKACKRIYIMHRSGNGRMWAMGVGADSIANEENIAKRSFMKYIENTRVRADLIKDEKPNGSETIFPVIPAGEDAMRYLGYSTTSIAFGASFFEISMYPLKYESDVLVLRGPLYAVEEGEPVIDIDFGRPGTLVDEAPSFAPLARRDGMSSAISSAKLYMNNGMGALRIGLSFHGIRSSAIVLDLGDTRISPVVEIMPRTILRPN